MARITFLIVFALLVPAAGAADLLPGALVRLGDDRYRAGDSVEWLALSPDGKKYATVHATGDGLLALAVWDAATGCRLHEQRVNAELFCGLVWGSGGAFAIVRGAEPDRDHPAKLFADDFRVWDFTDPNAAPLLVHSVAPARGHGYSEFGCSADGARVAARWESDGKHAVHVFELKPAASAAKRTRVGTIDLGAEGIDAARLSADGQTVVTFRRLANGDELTATAWSVETGKPARPVRAPAGGRLMLTPDASALVAFALEREVWGFDHFDLATGKRRELTRWRCADAHRPQDAGGFAFSPSGRELAVAASGQTHVIDLTTGKELGRLEGHASTPGAVAVSADGRTIATADDYGLVRVWDAKTFRPLSAASGHRAPVEHAELSPDGKRLLTWAPDETVRLWDVATGAELRAFTGAPRGGDRNNRPTFTPDGTAIVFRTNERLIARDLLTGLEVPLSDDPKAARAEMPLHTPDRRMSARDVRGAVQLVEDATGHVRRTLGGHRGGARVLGFTPDGTKLFTAGGDHTVLVWDMRLRSVPLPEAIKQETSAAKLWESLATGSASDAYLAMARLAHEPGAAVKLVRMKLEPATKGGGESDEAKVADARAVELLESLDTEDSRQLLKELAGGHAEAFRTQEAKRALERNTR